MYGFWFTEDTTHTMSSRVNKTNVVHILRILLRIYLVDISELLASVVKVTNASQATRLLAFTTLRNLLGAKIFCLRGRT